VLEYAKTFGESHQAHLSCLKRLAAAGSGGAPASDLEDAGDPFDQLQRELNRGLLALGANRMQYQISVVEPAAVPRFVLRPMSAFTIERSPARANASPHLRLAAAQYDKGDYFGWVETIIGELPKLMEGRMYVSDATVLFYYLAKALLKLNWYDLLDEVIAGPYERFSEQAFGGDLDAERLHIAGIPMRQRGRIDDSASCLRESIRLLLAADTKFGHPSIAMTLADIHVLLALDTGAVIMGGQYERPKVDRAIAIFDCLLDASTPEPPPWPPDRRSVDLFSPLI
jgi:hypothetical protein